MNKIVFGIVIVLAAAIALGTAGYVYAQAPSLQTPGTGYGMMAGGRGARGGMMGQNTASANQAGFMHDNMIAVFAQKLGISVDDLNTRLSTGETMAQIASSKGLTTEQFTTLMTDARNQAIDQAVKNGTLTQSQADWMKQHGAGQMMGSGRGMRGTGQSGNTDCPFFSQNQ